MMMWWGQRITCVDWDTSGYFINRQQEIQCMVRPLQLISSESEERYLFVATLIIAPWLHGFTETCSANKTPIYHFDVLLEIVLNSSNKGIFRVYVVRAQFTILQDQSIPFVETERILQIRNIM